MPERQTYAMINAAKKAEREMHAVQMRTRSAPGGDFVRTSKGEGDSTPWAVFVARSLTMRVMLRSTRFYFTLAFRVANRGSAKTPNSTMLRNGYRALAPGRFREVDIQLRLPAQAV